MYANYIARQPDGGRLRTQGRISGSRADMSKKPCGAGRECEWTQNCGSAEHGAIRMYANYIARQPDGGRLRTQGRISGSRADMSKKPCGAGRECEWTQNCGSAEHGAIRMYANGIARQPDDGRLRTQGRI